MRRVFKDVHVYFPPKVLADLKKLAKQNRRSVTAETVIAVEGHVERMREQQSEWELTREKIRREVL